MHNTLGKPYPGQARAPGSWRAGRQSRRRRPCAGVSAAGPSPPGAAASPGTRSAPPAPAMRSQYDSQPATCFNRGEHGESDVRYPLCTTGRMTRPARKPAACWCVASTCCSRLRHMIGTARNFTSQTVHVRTVCCAHRSQRHVVHGKRMSSMSQSQRAANILLTAGALPAAAAAAQAAQSAPPVIRSRNGRADGMHPCTPFSHMQAGGELGRHGEFAAVQWRGGRTALKEQQWRSSRS